HGYSIHSRMNLWTESCPIALTIARPGATSQSAFRVVVLPVTMNEPTILPLSGVRLDDASHERMATAEQRLAGGRARRPRPAPQRLAQRHSPARSRVEAVRPGGHLERRDRGRGAEAPVRGGDGVYRSLATRRGSRRHHERRPRQCAVGRTALDGG